MGSWPCGVVTCFDELWGSEGKAQVTSSVIPPPPSFLLLIIQVFAIVIEWMSNLPKEVLDNLDTVMYDDMCHLSKFSRNPVRKAKHKICYFHKKL